MSIVNLFHINLAVACTKVGHQCCFLDCPNGQFKFLVKIFTIRWCQKLIIAQFANFTNRSKLRSNYISMYCIFILQIYVTFPTNFQFQVLRKTLQQLENLYFECLSTSIRIRKKLFIHISHVPQVSNDVFFIFFFMSDTENIKLVFCAVKDTIMQKALQEFGFS